MSKSKSLLSITISRLISFILFLILLAIANLLIPTINNELFTQIINFLINNLSIILTFTILLFLGEFFMAIFFPINLIAPIFNAIGGMFLLTFILELILLGIEYFNLKIVIFLQALSVFLYPIIFLIILIVGYATIFSQLTKKDKKSEKKERGFEAEAKQITLDVLNNIRDAINKAIAKLEKKKK